MASHSAGPAASSTQAVQSQQIQMNVIKTMVIVSVFYAVTWLPGNIYYLLVNQNEELTFVDIRYYVTMLIAFLYTSANPFIYVTKLEPVRKVMMRMISRKKTHVQPLDLGTAGAAT